MSAKKLRSEISDVILRSPYKWRTARGIAKDVELPVHQVLSELESARNVIKARATNRRGEPLFTVKEKYEETATFSQRVLSAITNKLPE